MTQEQLNLLKSQLPISFTITMSMDYPNGMNASNAQFTRPDGSIGIIDVIPENSTFARVTGMIGKSPQYGVVLTWKYLEDPDNIIVDYCTAINGNMETIPILNLKQYLLKLKG
jgi:hypothetical protein